VIPSGQGGLEVFWAQDNINLNNKYNLNGNKFYRGFSEFYSYNNTNNVLFAFLTGDDAIYSEGLSDAVLLNLTYDILSTSFPQLNLPRPIQILR
jgi:hypothetical protein